MVKQLTFAKVKNTNPFGENEIIEDNPYHFEIFNSKGEKIGRINRTNVGRFMHWALFPDECDGHDLFFTNGCLKEISEFITKCYSTKKTKIKYIINNCSGFCYDEKCFYSNEENKVCPKCQKEIDKLNSEEDKTRATKHDIPPKSKDSGILPKFI